MSKTMAEVLAEHWFIPADYAYCICGVDLSPLLPLGVHEALAAHQAAVLSAAGFGPVQETKAEALEEAADALTWVPLKAPCDNAEACCGSGASCDAMRPSAYAVGADWLRARAAAIRCEQ